MSTYVRWYDGAFTYGIGFGVAALVLAVAFTYIIRKQRAELAAKTA